MISERKDPHQLLKDLDLLDINNRQGKLKIFFGYAAGVGKTYAMLEAAHEIQNEGVDVVVGYVEPHQRIKTTALVEGLEVIPPKRISYNNIETLEFDLDATLQRKPAVVLVDELAHTNAIGMRHKKRYQDIEELLDQGIDVYTSVNVQHLESLNDKVASITHILVKERVPDKIFDKADQVEVIDIEPEDLIDRLNKGNIYQKEKVEKALNHFFVKENLIALREIALRRTADRINQKVDSSINYLTNEHILVCISASPSNARVIRAAARMANAFHGKLSALYVEGSNIMEESDKTKNVLRENFRLAQSFGAQIAIVTGVELPLQIAEFAKMSGVSKIIIGRTKRKSTVFGYKLGFIDQLISLAPSIEIYVIPDVREDGDHIDNSIKRRKAVFQINSNDVLYMSMVLVLSTLFAFTIFQLSNNDVSVVLCYVIGIIFVSGKTTGLVYSFIYCIFSVLLFNFFFVPPLYILSVYEKSYIITFLLLIIVGIVISTTTTMMKNRAVLATREAYYANALLEMSNIIQSDEGKDFIIHALDLFERIFKMPVVFYGIENDDLQKYYCDNNSESLKEYLIKDESAVVVWVIKNKKRAGIGTDTLPGAKALYLPIIDNHKSIGCMAIVGDEEQIRDINEAILISMMGQFALVINKK